jgi:Flp pilus assembly protein TadD
MTVDWLSGIAMLLSGLVIGFIFIYSMKSKKTGASKTALAPDVTTGPDLRDLVARRDVLLDDLREVGDNAAERSRLEREAADVLRAIDVATAAAPVARPGKAGAKGSATPLATTAAASATVVPAPPGGINPAVKGFVWGALSVGVLAAMGWYVWHSATPRDESKPLTGAANPQVTQQQQPAQSDEHLRALEAAVQQHPDDLKQRNELAKAYFDRENLMAVFEQTKYVLDRQPNDPSALTYSALVRMAMGQSGPSEEMLQRATKSDPTLMDAWIGLAWLYTLSNRGSDAAAAIQQAIKHHPEEEARLTEILAQMRARGMNGGAAQPQQSSMTPQTPPMQTPGGGSAVASGPGVKITISLAPGAKVPAGGALFVYARNKGVTSGPPAAVKRLPPGPFPVTVELTAADSMMGQPLPQSMRIEARLDVDGNAMTRDPADLNSAQDGVSAGATVSLTLK